MRNLSAILLLAATMLVGGCRISDVRTVVIKAPGVGCEDCAKRVTASLASLEGVETEKLKFDFETGTVTVVYDSMQVAIKNLEYAIADAGYDVEAQPFNLPANPEAKASLPDTCRAHSD